MAGGWESHSEIGSLPLISGELEYMDVYQNDSTSAVAIISMPKQEVQFQDFFQTFDEVVKELSDQAKKQAKQ